MLVKTEEGRKYIIKFLHQTGQGSDGLPIPKARKFSQCTLRELKDDKSTEFLGIGYAYVHPDDNFVKEIGRIVSLNKALDDAEFSSSTKTIVFNAYHSRKPIKS